MPDEFSPFSSLQKPTGSGAARLRERKRRAGSLGSKSRWIILAIIAIFAAGIALSGQGRSFLRYLYGPVAIIVVIFAIIEYIVLKGRDRSRIYRLELDQLRARRRQDVEALRGVDEELARIQEDLRRAGAALGPPHAESGDADAGASPSGEGGFLRRAASRVADLRESLARRR